ncbi:MAG: ketoacyl-ACP synthase III [Bacteroidales bacterium]
MAVWNIKNVSIKGISGSIPDNIVKNADLNLFTSEESKLLIKSVGIAERPVATDKICASDLCFSAAEQLLKDLSWNKDSINSLIFESVTRDYRTPPTSCILQHRLNLSENTFTLDIPMGCCGFMYGMVVAGNLMQSGTVKRTLLLVGDTASRMGSSQDKSRVPLFGDAGVAIALEYNENANPMIIELNTDGSGYKALITPHGEFREPATPDSFIYHDFGKGIIRRPIDALIDGMEVFGFAISKPSKSIKNFFQVYNIDKDNDIDYFLIHQANKSIIKRLVKKLDLPIEKVPMDIEQYGNTGGASVPFLIVARLREQAMTKPLTLLASSFGLGLTWGTMLFKTEPMVISKLIKVK